MNENFSNDDQRPIVTSVGNAWVICNSKSRPGLKYYFNTFSGKSVWNLSPEEIEKAKSFTKALSISEIEKCPEPSMDPPLEHTMNPSQAQIYNEPFVRQIPNQIPNIFPMGLLDVNSLARIPNMRGPFPWSNQPTNPSTTPTPVIYLAYPQMGFQQPPECSQNVPRHFNEDSEHRNPYVNCRDNDEMFYGCNRTYDVRRQSRFVQRDMQQLGNWHGNSQDLRQKLMRKRTKSVSSEPASNCDRDEKDDSYHDFHTKNRNVGVQIITEETPSKYDLSKLEHLKSLQSNARNWFIVVDTEMVLRHFPVLDKITDPDRDCYLMVPDHVMKKLQMLVAIGGDVQTRRIFRFLSQQIEADIVFKGQDVTRNDANDEKNEDDTFKMLATCADLAEQNNVILLSNDVKYQSFKYDYSNVHVLTLNDLKQVLNKEHITSSYARNKSPTLGIKIVVPNNSHQDQKIPKEQLTRSKTPDSEIKSISPTKKNTIQPHPVPSPSKPTATEISKTFTENMRTRSLEQQFDKVDHMSTKTAESRPKLISLPMSLSNNGKEIKISRSTSLNANCEGTQTRQYRWRKTRNSCSKTNTKSLSAISEQASTDPTKHKEAALAGSLVPESSAKPISPKPILPQSPSLGRSSISSQKYTSRLNIVVEETSTSGVMSNITLDSDSIKTSHENIKKKTVSVCDDVEFEMFAVTGPSMEEVLRTRREEWVLRFVQIMEDTLKEVLRVDSPFQSRCYEYAPLWAADLPELARCIIKKFSDHFNVVDAANRLSFKLQRISDREGANVQPLQYMDMYSFGVYLIKSLKGVTKDSEDLNTADESLKKLLYDIQNANLDTSHNDTFADEPNESSTTKPLHIAKKPLELSNVAEEIDGPDLTDTNSKANMMPSKQESQSQIRKASQQQLETTFFSSLALAKKNIDKPTLTLNLQNTHSTPETSKIIQMLPQVFPLPLTSQNPSNSFKTNTIQDVCSDNNDSSQSKTVVNTEEDKTSSPIKVSFVRNFNSIPQFEEKLNKKPTFSNEPPIDEEYEHDDYDDDAYEDEYYDQNGELYCDNELEDGEIDVRQEETAEDHIEKATNEANSCEQANNEKFEWFIKEFTDEIRRTIKIVLTLCIKFGEESKNPNGPTQEAKDELKSASVSLKSINNALNSILDSETTPESNIIYLLANANLNDYVPSEELLLDYINIVRKCRDQVNACYEKVTLIMQVARIQQQE